MSDRKEKIKKFRETTLNKQDKLTAGDNIVIEDNVISSTASNGVIDSELSENSTNPVENRVVTKALSSKKDADSNDSIELSDIFAIFQ